ncbi:hypothetical protein E4T52_04750 [Aureobasidium sp. EXF-3400]|nr:hypothetical protein E4T51_03817 [Aureobasidium sp. EXF-12344]KAI4780340.1 hypothetical protein E4T52_04750 [Aureobasidium sp. EXF-3400]
MPKAPVSPIAQVFIPSTVPELEDTLPLYDSHQDRSGIISSKQWPIYSMVEFNDHELEKLESDINKAEDSTGQSVLITEPNSPGTTLLEIYERHIQLRDENKDIHPSLFIVVDKADYLTKGVLVIDLQVPTDSVRNVIGVLRCGYDEADLYCANLDIGNMSFIDYKEEEQRLWNGDNPAEWDGDLRDYHYDESSMEGQNRDREKVFAIMPEIVVVKRVDAEEALEELDRMAGELA